MKQITTNVRDELDARVVNGCTEQKYVHSKRTSVAHMSIYL